MTQCAEGKNKTVTQAKQSFSWYEPFPHNIGNVELWVYNLLHSVSTIDIPEFYPELYLTLRDNAKTWWYSGSKQFYCVCVFFFLFFFFWENLHYWYSMLSICHLHVFWQLSEWSGSQGLLRLLRSLVGLCACMDDRHDGEERQGRAVLLSPGIPLHQPEHTWHRKLSPLGCRVL